MPPTVVLAKSTILMAMTLANVWMMQLDFSVKSNQPITATVILTTINLNIIMMVATAVKAHASVQTSLHAAKMYLVLLTLVTLTAHCNTKTEPYDQWFQSGNPVNLVNKDAEFGTSVALVGRGGTVLAVGDPKAAAVCLFDKDGSKWVQRGESAERTHRFIIWPCYQSIIWRVRECYDE